MARTIPTVEPTRVTAGDSWEWDVERLSDYPASTWTLTYELLGPTRLGITATADGDFFEVRALPAATAPVQAATYRLVGYVSDGTDRFEVYSGVLQVDADPAAAASSESHAEKTLAIIEAAIEGRLTADVESYQVEGQAVNKIPMAELQRLRGRYASLVHRARSAGRFLRDVGVRFG